MIATQAFHSAKALKAAVKNFRLSGHNRGLFDGAKQLGAVFPGFSQGAGSLRKISGGRACQFSAAPMADQSEENVAEAGGDKGHLLEHDDEADENDNAGEPAETGLRLKVQLLAARVADGAHHKKGDEEH